MAGMFYSLQEVAQKLNRTADEVKELAKQGMLHEFRDGDIRLFKVDEVEALMSDINVMAPQEPPPAPVQPTDEEIDALLADTGAAEPSLEPAVPPEQMASEDEILLMPEPTEALTSEQPPAEQPPAEQPPFEESFADDLLADSELTGADTALTGEGIEVLGGTGDDFATTDDTVTKIGGTTGTSAEASLEEIEEDVNLDTFGSGSGLLDLSLQADDTSLGGILDEIYAPEGAEGQEPQEASSVEEMTTEAEHILPEDELVAPQPTPRLAAVARAYLEPPPDVVSNTLGVLLFLPLLAVVYTAIVAVAGFHNMMPAAREKIQGFIWYIAGGAGGVAVLVIIAAFMLGGKGTATVKKPKVKKAKRPKKAKKPKKGKKAAGALEPEPLQELEGLDELPPTEDLDA